MSTSGHEGHRECRVSSGTATHSRHTATTLAHSCRAHTHNHQHHHRPHLHPLRVQLAVAAMVAGGHAVELHSVLRARVAGDEGRGAHGRRDPGSRHKHLVRAPLPMLTHARDHSSPRGALARRIEQLTSEPLFPAGCLLEVSKSTLRRGNTHLVFQVGGCVCAC